MSARAPVSPGRVVVDRGAVDWVAVDWGTTHLRAWLMAGNDRVIERRQSDQGMGALTRDGFEPALDALLHDLPGRVSVLACGMVGARQGWAEAPYLTTPCAPPSLDSATRFQTARFDVSILPGIRQLDPADVMRGEETQILGFLADQPRFDGVLVMPGTHNKWVRISAGEVVGFRTFMTGELFALLSTHSVLRHSVAAQGDDDAAFDAGVAQGMRGDLAGALFSIRAESLLRATPPESARARLSGLLIGAELAAARGFWLGMDLAVMGDTGLPAAYARALAAQGARPAMHPADALTLAGLCAARTTHRMAAQ